MSQQQPVDQCLVRLASVAEAVANAAYAEQGLHAVVQAACDLFGAQTVAIILYDSPSGKLQLKLSRGLSAQYVQTFSRPLGAGVLAEIVLAGMALRLADGRADREAAEELKLEHEFGSAIAVQLSINRKPLGYIFCDHRQAEYFQREHVQTLRCLAHLASLAVEKAQLQDEVARLAVEDPVTGLSTYSYFHSRLCDEIERALRYNDSVGLILVELTNLFDVENIYGRPAAVEVVRHVSRLLQENTRGIDFAAPFRANQIMVCLIRADEAGLKVVAERVAPLADRIPAHCEVEGEGQRKSADKKLLRIGLSIGGAVAPQHGRDASTLILKVQNALLAAKRLGAGHYALAEG